MTDCQPVPSILLLFIGKMRLVDLVTVEKTLGSDSNLAGSHRAFHTYSRGFARIGRLNEQGSLGYVEMGMVLMPLNSNSCLGCRLRTVAGHLCE